MKRELRDASQRRRIARAQARDAGLSRLQRTTAALIAATAAAVGATTVFVANALPGRAVVQSGPPVTSPSIAPLAPPPAMPQPVYRQPVIISSSTGY